MTNYAEESLKKHEEWKGKIEVVSRVPVSTKEDLSLAYTPGVAEPCLEIQKDVDKSYDLTRRWNTCLVVTDGTAVLAFPALFRGAFDVRAKEINEEMKIAASLALANLIADVELNEDYIIPAAFDPRVKDAVSKAVAQAASDTGVARIM